MHRKTSRQGHAEPDSLSSGMVISGKSPLLSRAGSTLAPAPPAAPTVVATSTSSPPRRSPRKLLARPQVSDPSPSPYLQTKRSQTTVKRKHRRQRSALVKAAVAEIKEEAQAPQPAPPVSPPPGPVTIKIAVHSPTHDANANKAEADVKSTGAAPNAEAPAPVPPPDTAQVPDIDSQSQDHGEGVGGGDHNEGDDDKGQDHTAEGEDGDGDDGGSGDDDTDSEAGEDEQAGGDELAVVSQRRPTWEDTRKTNPALHAFLTDFLQDQTEGKACNYSVEGMVREENRDHAERQLALLDKGQSELQYSLIEFGIVPDVHEWLNRPTEHRIMKRVAGLQDKARELIRTDQVNFSTDHHQDVPLWFQGNVYMYSTERLLEREVIKFNKGLFKTICKWWKVAAKMAPAYTCVGRKEYGRMLLGIHYVLSVNRSFEEAQELVERDWKIDSEGQEGLNFSMFHKALYTLADHWTDKISAKDYIDFLERLFYTITEEINVDGEMFRTWKSLPFSLDLKLFNSELGALIKPDQTRRTAWDTGTGEGTNEGDKSGGSNEEGETQDSADGQDGDPQEVSKDVLSRVSALLEQRRAQGGDTGTSTSTPKSKRTPGSTRRRTNTDQSFSSRSHTKPEGFRLSTSRRRARSASTGGGVDEAYTKELRARQQQFKVRLQGTDVDPERTISQADDRSLRPHQHEIIQEAYQAGIDQQHFPTAPKQLTVTDAEGNAIELALPQNNENLLRPHTTRARRHSGPLPPSARKLVSASGNPPVKRSVASRGDRTRPNSKPATPRPLNPNSDDASGQWTRPSSSADNNGGATSSGLPSPDNSSNNQQDTPSTIYTAEYSALGEPEAAATPTGADEGRRPRAGQQSPDKSADKRHRSRRSSLASSGRRGSLASGRRSRSRRSSLLTRSEERPRRASMQTTMSTPVPPLSINELELDKDDPASAEHPGYPGYETRATPPASVERPPNAAYLPNLQMRSTSMRPLGAGGMPEMRKMKLPDLASFRSQTPRPSSKSRRRRRSYTPAASATPRQEPGPTRERSVTSGYVAPRRSSTQSSVTARYRGHRASLPVISRSRRGSQTARASLPSDAAWDDMQRIAVDQASLYIRKIVPSPRKFT